MIFLLELMLIVLGCLVVSAAIIFVLHFLMVLWNEEENKP